MCRIESALHDFSENLHSHQGVASGMSASGRIVPKERLEGMGGGSRTNAAVAPAVAVLHAFEMPAAPCPYHHIVTIPYFN